MQIIGAVDTIDVEHAAGWLYWNGVPNCQVQAHLGGRIVGEAMASLSRPDLLAAGFGDGNCGFRIEFFAPVERDLLPLVTIKPTDVALEIPKAGLGGYIDFLDAVRQKFPGVGVTSSLFGGLWTDRLDARKVLEGRVAAGNTQVELKEPILEFITRGALEMHGALGVAPEPWIATYLSEQADGRRIRPGQSPEARKILEVLPSIIYRDAVLKFLRGVLDDNPLISSVIAFTEEGRQFAQPSTYAASTSPAESVMILVCTGPVHASVDIVDNSHRFPEFDQKGQSRWISGEASAAVDVALGQNASVRSISFGQHDFAVISPGTIFRVQPGQDSPVIAAICIPSRNAPFRGVSTETTPFRVKHFSGAELIA